MRFLVGGLGGEEAVHLPVLREESSFLFGDAEPLAGEGGEVAAL